MEEKVLEILKNVFELDSVDETCSQTTCEKWDSMGQLNLVVELETEFDVTLEPEEIGDMKCFNDIIRILDSLTTDEAFAILDNSGCMKEVASGLVRSILYYLNRRAGDKLDIECIMYTKDLGQLAASEGAVNMIEVNKEKWNG